MDYRIEKHEAFNVVGKPFETTCENQEQSRQIPMFWGESYRDGTVEKLAALASDGKLIGIIADMQQGKDTFNYIIAGRSEQAPADGDYVTRTIPTAN